MNQEAKHTDLLVIGAGVAGLGVAFKHFSAGREVVVLESAAQVGGAVQSHREDGWLAEEGPHSLQLGDPALDAALRRIPGVEAEMLEALPEANKRFLVRNGRIVAVPGNPLQAVASPLLSWRGKLRFAAEPFIAKGSFNPDETAASFVRRRLGEEAYTNLIDALIGGIYAGDGERLRLHAAFPKLARLETGHGSLIRGSIALILKKRREAKKTGQAPFRKRIISFRNGLHQLPQLIASALGERVLLSQRIRGIETAENGWSVSTGQVTYSARELIVAVPAHQVCRLPWATGLGDKLSPVGALNHPPVSVLTLGFPRDAVDHPLDGFGVLCPTREKQPFLGVLFPSSIFPKRAPENHVTLAVFLGGTRQPDLASGDPNELWRLIEPSLTQLLGLRSQKPSFCHLRFWPQAIPQYDELHRSALEAVAQFEAAAPAPVSFIGNYRNGIALPATLLAALLC